MLLLLLGLTGLNLHLKATQHTLQQCDKSQVIASAREDVAGTVPMI